MAFLAAALLGSRYGSIGFGEFSLAQSRLQLVASAATLGLPQALIYFIARGQAPEELVKRLTRAVVALALLLGIVFAIGPWDYSPAAALVLALASATLVLNASQRARLLGGGAVHHYSIVTGLPQGLLLIFVALSVAINPDGLPQIGYIVLLWAPFVVSSVYGRWALYALPEEKPIRNAVLFRAVFSFALAAGLVGLASNGARAMWLGHLYSVMGASAVGVFSAALLMVQIGTYPATLVSPVLMRAWTAKRSTDRIMKAAIAVAAFGLLAFLGGQALSLLDFGDVLTSRFGEYESLIPMLGTVSLLLGAEMAYLIGATLLLSRGHAWAQFVAELGRLSVLAAALLCASDQKMTVEFALEIWLMASSVAAGVSWVALLLVARRSEPRASPR
jgi:O-antigen/teichoic acid export membrane protein